LKDWRGTGKPPTKSKEEDKGGPEVLTPKKSHLRNTVPDMQAAQEEDRGQRSQSAPPQDSHKHVSKIDIQPASQDKTQEDNSHQANTQSAGPSPRPKDENAHGQSKPQGGPTVRHIPIFVEGRDEPLLPKEAQDIPVHHETWTSRPQHPPSHSRPQPTPSSWQNQQPSSHQWQTNAKPPQPTPIPKPPPHQKAAPPHQTPKTSQEREIRITRDEPDSSHSTTPPPQKQVKHVETPLEKVAAVQLEVDDLKKKVEQYQGNSKSDKEYIYLDEMLTRNLLKLDNIETEGKEDVRTARKNVIKDIQRYISMLETKVGASNDGQNSAGMEVDSSLSNEISGQSDATTNSSNSQVEQMEVDKQSKGETPNPSDKSKPS